MHSLLRYIAGILIWLLITAGLLAAGLRFTLANVSLFRADIEAWVAHELAPGISFGELRSYWNGVDPVLELKNTAITLPDHSRPIAIDVLSIQIDLWDTLVLGTPVIVDVSGSIEKLVIRKDSEKQWWLNDIHLVADKSGEAVGDLEDWLSSIPHFLQLELKRMIIEDNTSQRNYYFNNIQADIQHHGAVTHVQLLADLPEAFGGGLEFKSLLEGDKGVVYLQTDQLKLSPLADLLDMPLSGFRRVELSGQGWINLQNHHISSVKGMVNINKASYQPELDDPALPFQLAVEFDAGKQAENWHISSHVKDLLISEKELSDVDLQWRVLNQPQEHYIQAWIGGLDIAGYSGLIGNYLPIDSREMLVKGHVQGMVRNIWMQVPVSEPSRLGISASLENVKTRRVGSLPGVDQLDAEIVYTDYQAALTLSSNDLHVDFGDEFRAPFEIDRFNADATLAYSGDELTLALSGFHVENQDIQVAGRMWMESDLQTLPFMSLHLEFDHGIASRKSKYLPVKLLPEKALEWLDESIRAGDISNGRLLYHGRLQSIQDLDQEKSGQLYAAFDLNNAEVQFDPDWAIAKQAGGRLVFHNMGVNIELDSVNYDRVDNARATIRLPTYANTSIVADIQAVAGTGNALETWLSSPVGEDYRDIADNFSDLEGQVDATIKLFIPIQDESLTEDVEVKLDLKNAAAHAPGWGVKLTQAQGRLTVTEESISANGIKANFFEDPVEIDVATDLKQQQTMIDAKGLIDTAQLFNLLPDSLTRGIDGRSEWKINLAIANTVQTGDSPVLVVNARSNMQGTSVYFPAPYGKESTHNRQLTGELALQGDGDILFETLFSPDLSMRGVVEKSPGNDYQLADLDLAFDTPLKPAQADGINLYGKLAELPLDEWIVLHQTEKARQQTGSRNLMPILQTVDMEVKHTSVFGRNLSDLKFHLKQSEAGLSGDIKSKQADGEFFFPWQDSVQNPVVIDMNYLRLARRQGPATATALVPNDFFNTRFRSKLFAYDGREVTDLEIDTSIDGEFLLIDTLSFNHDNVRFEANGYWLYSAVTAVHDSFLALTVKGRQFGQTLAALGFGDTIHNGDISFRGELNWPGPILDPNWDIVRGKGRFKLEDGILKDVEPGTGRFVGLFSLSALPRRLALDFSDVLFDGLEFDEIKGNLELKGQNLFTGNTKLDGPAAEVKIVGRTGLRDRDYDQKIYVVPKIRQALPVIGSIAAGSTVGWALLLLQNLLKSSIDESLEIEYSMTGSWDDPVIKALNEPVRNTEEPQERTGNFEK